jgi:adenosylcobinamide-GDP ribazoletransferase
VIRQLAAAIAFLTRLPVPSRAAFDTKDVARSMRWFPLVGLLIGGFLAAGLLLFTRLFPALVTGLLTVAIEALLTGALHLDGLADTADGLSARDREDVLRIMRDHAIGSYGAVALILAVALKAAMIGTLIERGVALPYLALMPVLGRWSLVFLSATQPYARRTAQEGAPSAGAVTDFVGRVELSASSATAIPLSFLLAGWRGFGAFVVVAAVSALWGSYCRRRIGGVTGDTLGTGAEISEVLVLTAAVIQV